MKKLLEALWKQKNRRFVRRLNSQDIRVVYDFPIPVEALGRRRMGIMVEVNKTLCIFICNVNPWVNLGQALKVKKAIPLKRGEVEAWNDTWTTVSVPCVVVEGVEVVQSDVR